MVEGTRVVSRPVRHIVINTGRPWAQFREEYESAVPSFDRMEAIGVVLSGSGWEAIQRLSDATATNGFVNFFTFDPSPVMHLNGTNNQAVTYLTGNILLAEKAFREKAASFLYVPLRVVISADDDGEAHLAMDHPADLFAAYRNPSVDVVAEQFVTSFADLLKELHLPIPLEFAANP
jgi:uncharacterized protein (DUF302 family)